jgi:flagellar hook-basal body complex protein FliE
MGGEMAAGLHQVNTVAANLTNSSQVMSGGVRASGDPLGSTGNLFADLLTNAIGKTNDLEDQARAAVDGFMTGKGVDVHQVMIAAEKANMAFEMVLAVRNKAVQSYQSVMSMQF